MGNNRLYAVILDHLTEHCTGDPADPIGWELWADPDYKCVTIAGTTPLVGLFVRACLEPDGLWLQYEVSVDGTQDGYELALDYARPDLVEILPVLCLEAYERAREKRSPRLSVALPAIGPAEYAGRAASPTEGQGKARGKAGRPRIIVPALSVL